MWSVLPVVDVASSLVVITAPAAPGQLREQGAVGHNWGVSEMFGIFLVVFFSLSGRLCSLPFYKWKQNFICIGASCSMALDFHGMYFTSCLISLINGSQPPVLVVTEGFFGALKPFPQLTSIFAPPSCELSGLFAPPKHSTSMWAVLSLGVPGVVLVAGRREDPAASFFIWARTAGSAEIAPVSGQDSCVPIAS